MTQSDSFITVRSSKNSNKNINNNRIEVLSHYHVCVIFNDENKRFSSESELT